MHAKLRIAPGRARTLIFALPIAIVLDCALADPTPTKEPSSVESPTVRITWHFAAPPEKVWEAWTQPRAVAQWFGSDPKGKVVSAKLDVQRNGSFEVTFLDSDGTRHTASGVYQQVEPYRLLKFSWSWASEPGIETQVTVALIAQGASTKMEFEHAGHTRTSSHDYASGWRSTFEKMQRVIAQP